MTLWSSSDPSGASVTLPAPEVQPGHTLLSSSSGYSVLEFIGEGCFGRVARCRNLATQETVAVKILKKDTDYLQDTEREVAMMEVISVLNPDHSNMVKFFEQFEHLGQTCLAFEMLDKCLYQMMLERYWIPLSLKEILTIAEQLLVALDALKGLGVLHTDIKPDNVMCVNQLDQPFRVKLIDFGEAMTSSEVQTGMDLQPAGYRSPEIALGLPFTEAIDVWGVGCILAFLYLAENLFPVDCEYQMVGCLPQTNVRRDFGRSPSNLEADGRTPYEFTDVNNIQAEERHSLIDLPGSLDDLVNIQIHPEEEAAEIEDSMAFVDLLKRLLHVDGDQRISPQHALQHSFITKWDQTEPFDSRAP
ncbi:Homeodomain-interacting protein kinase 1 [Dissostichus eleginoides]|uniref:Homeodomain-interacting protein kinase 1 n=1 Tax=Dissostichus eleginoides TaxID=100907 RepID=A0AAD9FEP1_DISEL|nr:Homeodomain-interacting protein kinase 1 [Dissostichus eleginoides]